MKSKKIYAIEQGEYSDYRVVGVYSTKEGADAVCAALNNPDPYSDAAVVEWKMDKAVDVIKKGYKPFHIWMMKDGTVERADVTSLDSSNIDEDSYVWRRSQVKYGAQASKPDILNATVIARDQKHAIKIVNERRIQLLALNQWEKA